VTLRPARPPARAPIAGARVVLEPADPAAHADDLFRAGHDGGDPSLWDFLPYGPFGDAAALRSWLEGMAAGDDPLLFAIVDRATGRAAGAASYLRMEPTHGVIEVGHIWFGASLQRTPAATEAIFLLARHAFDDLGHRRLEWKCDARNARSRRAAERFGFTFEGVFRQHMIVKGANRDTAWYAILDGEWPFLRAAFERWLAPANFDAAGRQRTTLEAQREAAA
jgi:RimJ/RimL family protein N-acetyltransferase